MKVIDVCIERSAGEVEGATRHLQRPVHAFQLQVAHGAAGLFILRSCMPIAEDVKTPVGIGGRRRRDADAFNATVTEVLHEVALVEDERRLHDQNSV